MSKSLYAIGACTLAVASFAVLSGGAAPTSDTKTAAHPPAKQQPNQSPTSEEQAPTPSGVQLRRLPASLAAHLGVTDGSGLLIERIGEGSPGGLELHDVILEVNRKPASSRGFDRAWSAGRTLGLRIVRNGVEQLLTIEPEAIAQTRLVQAVSAGPAEAAFLSASSLDEDHPFLQLAAYHKLEKSYESRSEVLQARMQEADTKKRNLRKAAKQQARELQKQCEAQVAAYTAAREKELMELLDARLQASLLEPLAGLRLSQEQVFSDEHAQAIDQSRANVEQALGEAFQERLVFDVQDPRDAKRARQTLTRVARESGEILDERCGEVWEETAESAREHSTRLAPQHDERAKWIASTVKNIHSEVGERVTCAFKRTREEFSKQLARRLSAMKLPHPGEVEACLEDVRRQCDRMARRFVSRTEAALARYERRVAGANQQLLATVASRLPACTTAWKALETRLEGLFADHLGAPLFVDASWQSREDLRDLANAFRVGLARLGDDAQLAVRAACVPLERGFREHRLLGEEAWRDLRRELSALHSEARGDCWKIDGPHLDGRFPKAEKAPRGEISMRDAHVEVRGERAGS